MKYFLNPFALQRGFDNEDKEVSEKKAEVRNVLEESRTTTQIHAV